jgi:hypothetical protein
MTALGVAGKTERLAHHFVLSRLGAFGFVTTLRLNLWYQPQGYGPADHEPLLFFFSLHVIIYVKVKVQSSIHLLPRALAALLLSGCSALICSLSPDPFFSLHILYTLDA